MQIYLRRITSIFNTVLITLLPGLAAISGELQSWCFGVEAGQGMCRILTFAYLVGLINDQQSKAHKKLQYTDTQDAASRPHMPAAAYAE